jgi:predicted class III extradiol MEMO1 family dioxygenase
VKIVPILVGSCTPETEAMYGRLLAKYLDDPKNFFSVSSDFCHWGSRYALQSSCSSFSEFQVASTSVCCAYFVLNDGYLRYLVRFYFLW